MRRTTVETEVAKCPIKPDHDAQRRHGAAALGLNKWPNAGRGTAICGECLMQIGVHRDQSSAAVLGRSIAQLDYRADITGRIKHHVPGQFGNLTGPQASLGGKQDDHAIAEGMPGAGNKNQEVIDVAKGEYFCLLTWHGVSLSEYIICIAKWFQTLNGDYRNTSILSTDKESSISLSVCANANCQRLFFDLSLAGRSVYICGAAGHAVTINNGNIAPTGLPKRVTTLLSRTRPEDVRFIKLGRKSAWWPIASDTKTLRLGVRQFNFDCCIRGKWEKARQLFIATKKLARERI